MKKLYARFVLWLIRPAIERRESDEAAQDLARLKASLASARHDPSDFSWLFSPPSRDSSGRAGAASKPLGGFEGQALEGRPSA